MNTQRRFDLDWVRIAAFMLLIFYHVGMYYVTWDFHIKSPYASAAIEPLMTLSSPWRLSLLFLVSGVATAYLLNARPDGFLGKRSVRLLLPLLFGMLVIVPPQSYLQVVERLHYAGSYIDFYKLYLSGYKGFCDGGECLILPTWNHLWFVAYLWVYTVVLYVVLRLLPRLAPQLAALAESKLTGVSMLLVPLAYLAVVRIWLAPRFPQTHALVDDWYSHAVYWPTFAAGFVLARTQSPWAALERLRWPALVVALVSWITLSSYYAAYAAPEAIPPDWLRMVMRCDYAAQQWLSIAAVLGFARRHWAHDNAARRYLTTAIFPVYILHQTIIIVAAHALKPADINPLPEGFLLVAITAAASFGGYEVIRRIPVLRPLFGLAPKAGRLSRSQTPTAPLGVGQDVQ